MHWRLASCSTLDSAPMVVHAGLDFVDRGFEGHAMTEWSHEAQGVAAKIEILILELCRPSGAQHVFEAGADVPSSAGGAHYICAAYPTVHLETIIGIHPGAPALCVKHQRPHHIAQPAVQGVIPVVIAGNGEGRRRIDEIGLALSRS